MRNFTLDQLLGGLKQVESSGRYDAVGPAVKRKDGSIDHAYGFSQVMGSNIPNWTQEVLGRSMTPQEYLNDQKAQEQVTRAKLGGYLSKYGNPQDAISMWFSGKPLGQAGNASDGYMKTPDYVNKVMAFAEQQPQDVTPAPQPVMNDAAPLQEQTLVPGSQQQDPYGGVGPALANIGSIVAGLDRHANRGLVAGLANTADNLVAQQRVNQNQNGWDVAGFTDDKRGALLRNKSTGEIKVTPLPAGFASPEQTPMEKDLAAAKRNPDLMPAYESKYGLTKLEPSLSDETRRMYAMRALKGDNSWTREIGGDKQGNVDKRAIDEEQTKLAKELGLDTGDVLKARTELRYRNKVADRIAQIDVNTDTAANKIDAAASNLIETSKQYPRGDIRFLEGLKQRWDEQTNDPKLQALKTAIDAFSLDYATALNPQKTSPTVDDVRNARNKILTTMNQESLEAAVGIVQREIGSIRQNARRTHEQWFGSSDAEPSGSGKQPMIRGDSPEPAKTASPDAKNAIPMPSRITTPADFDAYVRENKIPPGTPFRMGDRVIYSK